MVPKNMLLTHARKLVLPEKMNPFCYCSRSIQMPYTDQMSEIAPYLRFNFWVSNINTIRGVKRGWSGLLVPTLGFYKNRVLGWTKKNKGRQNPKIPPILLFAHVKLILDGNGRRNLCYSTCSRHLITLGHKNVNLYLTELINVIHRFKGKFHNK